MLSLLGTSLLGGGLKYFLFSPLFGEDEPILTSIFFRWVGSTTNQLATLTGFSMGDFFHIFRKAQSTTTSLKRYSVLWNRTTDLFAVETPRGELLKKHIVGLNLFASSIMSNEKSSLVG